MARLNSVADIIKSGLVWVPTTRWAEDLVEEVAGFPFMSHDDQVDTCIMAMMRFREGGFSRLPQDEYDELDEYELRKPVNYY
jgi:phage terminase large subunit-like protein